ncbi:MAG: nitroreductase/quinone reductase family protein, partial [Aggregatilineales bacterium]
MSDVTQKKSRKRLWQYIATLPLYLHRIGLGIVFAPFPFIVLTTRGNRTGQARHVVLEWRRHGSRYYLVSVNGA